MEPLLQDLLEAPEPAAGADWLLALRADVAERLRRDGLPGARNESWKYTSLRALQRRRFQLAGGAVATPAIDASALPGAADGPRLVFVNGQWRDDLSSIDAVPGLQVQRLSEQLPQAGESLQAAFAADDNGATDAFVRLNTLLANDGVVVRVAAGSQIDQALHLVYLDAPAEADLAWHLRNIVEVGEGASLNVVIHYTSSGDAAHLGNVVNDYVVAESARLNVVELQHGNDTVTLIRRSHARLQADARMVIHSSEAGAHLSRHDVVAHLLGDRAHFTSHGVFVLRGRQHCDTQLDVQHHGRDTGCDLLWRGVAKGRGRGVIRGAITILAGADGTDAQFNNKNLLLSPHAEIDTLPALEIHADEVKAAHGATVGQLDEQALFYLRSRGIPLVQARAMLILAFCRAAMEQVAPESLREHLLQRLAERLPLDND